MGPVLAYLDAGTGSMLLAAIAGGAAGVTYFFRSLVARVTGRGRGTPAGDEAAGPSEAE